MRAPAAPTGRGALRWSACAAPASRRSAGCSAQHLGWPFIELDRVVEEDYGASIPDLIEMAGTATFRRHERSALERVIATHEAAVITTAGGIVAEPGDLRAAAAPQPYDLDQGAAGRSHEPGHGAGRFPPDGGRTARPIPKAMADLVAILEARRADYARAEAEVDTSGAGVEQSFAKLLELRRLDRR